MSLTNIGITSKNNTVQKRGCNAKSFNQNQKCITYISQKPNNNLDQDQKKECAETQIIKVE